MVRLARVLLGWCALAAATTASAQVEPNPCTVRYEPWRFDAFLDEVDRQYISLELRMAVRLLDEGQASLLCLAEPVSTRQLARYAIRRAFAEALGTDASEGERWAGLAFTLDPSVTWPEYVPMHHAARAFAATLTPRRVSVPGVAVIGVHGGSERLDGRPLDAVAAEIDMPHLLQALDRNGRVVWSRWIDGAGFPEDVLAHELPGPSSAEAKRGARAGPGAVVDEDEALADGEPSTDGVSEAPPPPPPLPDDSLAALLPTSEIDPDDLAAIQFARPPPVKPAQPDQARGWTSRNTRRLATGLGLGAASGALFATAHVGRAMYDRQRALGRPASELYYVVDGSVIASAATAGLGLVYVSVALAVR